MRRIIVNGPTKIEGVIPIQGSKNTMLVNLVLPVLTKETCVINNVPRIRDVLINLDILASLGAQVEWLDPHRVSINCKNIKSSEISPEVSSRTTSSRFFIPLLVLRCGQVETGISLGDNIGSDRGFSDFVKMLEQFCIKHKKINGRYKFYLDKKSKAAKKIDLNYPSFSGTVGAVLAGVLGEDDLAINGANRSAEVDNIFEMLRIMGAKILQEEDRIKVTGVKKLSGCSFNNLSDNNALVTYSVAALITNSNATLTGFTNVKLEAFWNFLDRINAHYLINKNKLILFPSLSQLRPTEIYADTWPKFHTDWQPLVAPLLSVISGESSIIDNVWSDRFGYWSELEKMGAKGDSFKPNGTRFSDNKPHGIKIHGKAYLKGSRVFAKDVRGGACLVLAGMAAEGKTTIENVEQIERGYDDLVGTLSKLGANIHYEES